jgi:hypothetical protein
MTVPAANNLRRQLFSTMALIDAQNHDRISNIAADLLDAIDALHQPYPLGDGRTSEDCDECGDRWPCPTARLLHPEEADRG